LFIDEFEIRVGFAQPLKPSLRTEFGFNSTTGLVPAASPAPEQRAEVAWNHSSGLADHFAPPTVPGGLPSDWDKVDSRPDLLSALIQGLIDTLKAHADGHDQHFERAICLGMRAFVAAYQRHLESK
jgi:hypothetical protein